MKTTKKKLNIRECTPDYRMFVKEAPRHHLAASCDNGVGPGTKNYFGFATLDAFLAWYEKHTPKACYEILRFSLPVSVAFDVECEFDKENHQAVRVAHDLSLEPARFLEQVLRVIGSRLSQLAGHTPVVSSSHAPGKKISFHIKYAHATLPDMAERDKFKQLVLNVFSDFVPVIDPSVYDQNKNMRLLYSHKWNSSARPLVPVGAETEPFNAAEVARHMWCVPHADAVPFDFTPFSSDMPRAVLSPVPDVSTTCKSSSVSRKRSREAHSTDDEWVTAVRELMRRWKPPTPERRLADSADLEVQVKRRDAFGPGGSLYFFTNGQRVCPHGHEHTSDNFGISVGDSGNAYLHCYSSECAGLKDQYLGSIAAPAHLLPTGDAASESFSEAASYQLRAASSASERLWLAKDVAHVNWAGDGMQCTIELRPECAKSCPHCGVQRFSTVRVVVDAAKGRARVRHEGRAPDSLPCSFDIGPLFEFQKEMHVAFERARNLDSRQLSLAERRAVTRTLGFPEFAAADAGWSAALELCVVLRLRCERHKFRYLVVRGSVRSAFCWQAAAPWVQGDATPVTPEVIKALLQMSV